MYLKHNQLDYKFKQGSRISFAYSNNEELICYIDTWKRHAYTRHSPAIAARFMHHLGQLTTRADISER